MPSPGLGISATAKGTSLLVGECLSTWGDRGRVVGWYTDWVGGRHGQMDRWKSNGHVYVCRVLCTQTWETWSDAGQVAGIRGFCRDGTGLVATYLLTHLLLFG